jgi:signal transduction histidine kinase
MREDFLRLNAIIGYVDLITMGLRGEVTPGQARDLERIRSSGRRLLALINDILNFARLEAGKVEIVLQPVRLDVALRGLQSSFLPQLKARELRYRYEGCPPDLMVQADLGVIDHDVVPARSRCSGVRNMSAVCSRWVL